MIDIITDREMAMLIAQAWKKELANNEYLQNWQNSNLKLISELFFAKDLMKAKSFNVWSNLFSSVTDIVSNFVWSPLTDINIDLAEFNKDLISVWTTIFWINRIDDWSLKGALDVYRIPAEDYLYSNNEHKVIKVYSVEEEDETKYYMLKQVFTDGLIENELYSIKSPSETEGTKVNLADIPYTEHLKDTVRTWLEWLAIFPVSKESMLEKIKQLVYSVDRKAVMFETQFLQELEQYKIFENIHIPETALNANGTVDLSALWKVVATDTTLGASWDIRYIKNTNDLIKDAIEYEQVQLKRVASSTTIPSDFLGVADTTAISGTSREIMIQSFIKTIEWYRKLLWDALLDILTLLEWQKNKNWDSITTNIIWKDVISPNSKDLADELKVAREAGIVSQFTWVKKYLWLTEEADINEELKLIDNEVINENLPKD